MRPVRRSGSAMVEFSLVFPIVLFSLLCFIQLALLIHGKLILNYGAFAATRSGIVYNGREEEMRDSLCYVLSPFYRRVHQNSAEFSAGLNAAVDDYNSNNISIEILEPSNFETRARSAYSLNSEFNSNERILHVRVSWNFPLLIPLANRFFRAFVLGVGSPNWQSPQMGHYMAPNTFAGNDLRFPLFSDYRLRLTGINNNSPYHD